ncbi:hypothetical protein [Caldimonas sp. KR1-144]|uniref:hypothetical protein n=1 Tax=Caldimonas sp. KR1-144 TaxID=3400911 RepID=UPI003BFE5BBA
MAGLRDAGISIREQSPTILDAQDRAEAAGMSQFSRGLRAGTLGAEANYLAADEAEARARGDYATAEGLRSRQNRLRDRISIAAPSVSRVEDIGGVGDAVDYGLGTVGQALASTADPLLAGAAAGAAGRVAGAGLRMAPNPVARAAGLALGTLSAGAGAYVPSYRQMKGEGYTELQADPVASQLNDQELNDQASRYGALAAGGEALLPAALGAGLPRAVTRGLRGRAALPLRLAGGAAVEGGTELAQGELLRRQIGEINPDRDTTGDASARLNEFVGGAVGGGGMSVSGTAIDAGARSAGELARLGRQTAGALGERAGEVLDLQNPDSPARQAKDAVVGAGKAARGATIDLYEGAKARAPGAARAAREARDYGVQVLDRLKRAGQDATDRATATFELASEQADLLDGSYAQKVPKQITDAGVAADWLKQKDGERRALVRSRLEALTSSTDATDDRRTGAARALAADDMDAGAQLVMGEGRLARAREVVSQMAGMTLGSKRNAQGADEPLSFDDWAGSTERPGVDKARAELGARFMANRVPEAVRGAGPVRRAASGLFYALQEARARAQDNQGQIPERNAALNRTIERIVGLYGQDAPAVIDEALTVGGKNDAVANYVRQEVRAQLTPAGVQAAGARRAQLASSMVDALGAETELRLSREGIDLRTARGRDELLRVVEDFSERGTPAQRRQLETLFGSPAVEQMLSLLDDGRPGATDAEALDRAAGKVAGDSSDGDVTESDEVVTDEADADFEQRQAEKKVAKRSGEATYYWRDGNSTTRGVQTRVFDPRRRFMAADETFSDGRPALQSRLDEVRERLNPDGTERFAVEAVPATQFFKDERITGDEVLRAFIAAAGRSKAGERRGSEFAEVEQLLEREQRTAEEERIVQRAKAEAYEYFRTRSTIRVTPMTDPEAAQVKLSDVKRLDRDGRAAVDNATKGLTAGSNDARAAEGAANILHFRSTSAAAKDGDFPVRVSDLVYLARKARGEGEAGGAQARETNKSYLDDLSAGIAMLLDSGLVDAKQLPYKFNEAGKVERFTKDGVPPSLRLVSTTAGGMEAGRALRAQRKVADPEANRFSENEGEELADDVSGDTEAIDNAFTDRRAKTEDDGATPLDFDRDDPQFTGARIMSATQLRSPTGQFRLTRINAAGPVARSYADFLQNELADADPDRQRGAIARIEQLLSAAGQRRGDVQAAPWLVSPIAELTRRGAQTIARDDDSGLRQQMLAWRKRAAEVLRNAPESSISPAVKRDIVRLMARDPQRVTTENMDAMLDRLVGVEQVAQKAAPEVAAPAAPKSQREAAGPRSAQEGQSERVATDAEMDEAREYVARVLGPTITTEFERITGYAGEWIEARNVMRISTAAAPGVLQVSYHEAMHAFWSRFVAAHPQLKRTLASVASSPAVLRQLQRLLAGQPAALAQLADAEERVAYAYQFWAAGLLDIAPAPRTLFQKVARFFKRALRLASDAERAQEIFELFHKGQLAEPSAAGQAIHAALNYGTWPRATRRKLDRQLNKLAGLALPAHDVIAQLDSPTAKKLAQMLYVQPGASQDATEEGYLNARQRVTSQYLNLVSEAIEGLDEKERAELVKHLQANTRSSFAPVEAAHKRVRALLDRYHTYATEAGLKLRKVQDYFPRVWDTQALWEKRDEFVQLMATKYAGRMVSIAEHSGDPAVPRTPETGALLLWESLVAQGGVEDKLAATREDGVLTPWMEANQTRELRWLEAADVEPFLDKDLVTTLTRYFRQGVRAAEYTRRFGERGEKLYKAVPGSDPQGLLVDIERELAASVPDDVQDKAGWVERRMHNLQRSVGAIEGSLGKDVKPWVRKVNSYAMVYQNLRLLPLALFSSIVDPLGIVARGGELQDAYNAFVRGVSGVMDGWRRALGKERTAKADEWERLAEFVGVVDDQHFLDTLGDAYASEYLDERARRLNNKLFTVNGMEAWNRSMKIAATKAAVQFIERHGNGKGEDSVRWTRELGLEPGRVELDKDGRLITSAPELAAAQGVSIEEARSRIATVHSAINRWVTGAVLSPNAAQRPAWASDPSYSLLFHLKQFTYSFHQTILRRAVRELQQGNFGPMAAFVWYVPVMIASDIVKGLIQGGGELPAYMQGYNAGDWVMHGVQRAGLLGVGQIGMDINADPFGVLGPTVEQVTDALVDPADKTLVRALPFNPVYREALL